MFCSSLLLTGWQFLKCLCDCFSYALRLHRVLYNPYRLPFPMKDQMIFWGHFQPGLFYDAMWVLIKPYFFNYYFPQWKSKVESTVYFHLFYVSNKERADIGMKCLLESVYITKFGKKCYNKIMKKGKISFHVLCRLSISFSFCFCTLKDFSSVPPTK